MSNLQTLVLAIQIAAGASLFWSSFCRLSKTSTQTFAGVRYVVWVQSTTALSVMTAPFLPLIDPNFCWEAFTTPHEVWISLVMSSAAIQIITSRHWAAGVPRAYTKPQYLPKRRASDPFETDFGMTQ